MGLIIFVEDTIDELKKLIATKRVTLPPRNIRESATETDAEDNFTAKKKEKSEEIREVLKQKINDLEKITINEINQENRSIGNKNRKSNQQCISKDKSEKNETKRTTECNILLHYNLEKENKTLKLQILEKNSKIDEQSTQIRELSTLNIELQKNIISYFDEFKVTADKFEEVKSREGTATPPVGFIRKTDNTIHLGRNVWLSKLTYDAAFFNARTNQMIVKNLAVAVFGLKVLQESSVTGMKCNKYKDRKPKPKLNETKILAIQDIFQYWLSKIKKCSEVEVQVECSKVPLYIARKISDLNRPAKSSKIEEIIDIELKSSNNIKDVSKKRKFEQLDETTDNESVSDSSDSQKDYNQDCNQSNIASDKKETTDNVLSVSDSQKDWDDEGKTTSDKEDIPNNKNFSDDMKDSILLERK
ncbi:uncharacterized protein LOC118647032 isoform X1 [Monomorium pharaonis]|uniref:uncharacterized protein LOC118645024 isoform X1 n=1 Tax=Monomorium pharaonis TaxID=307658 RepID=UPI0017474E6B|nr:uncharacterized protein LOC118645024 isoform X1 [Monomorium pharaonis]XP_036147052.1 uncharacterized protein LOC118647032 isoform X1 [Monomorium pharaonis]